MTRKRTLVIGLLVAGVLFVGGAGVVFLQVNAAHSAVSTTGTIQSAQVDKYTPVKRRPVIGNTQYRANVTYTYSVQGKKYTSNRVFPGHYTAYATEKPIAKVANTYHHGEPVTVYYSPSNPSASYLVKRYAFVPGFLAMVIAPYIAAVLLTPGFGWMDIVRQIVRQSLNDLRRTSTSELSRPGDVNGITG
ncbi:hypothetical protein A4G99_17625 [Haladaptatus sp. R4]|uniref:DUF3592 domain-containing protein n=1 Tax=Haladaptatus sp. R4 TaxID=1679489 RepID=UPI0007B4A5B8|nr:DUF3592 domain-containing protein [Haladaptatus sp. R4]KZN22913.1 hypothetical protein A4G99_17625 [Haladaptatus sp. R4]